MTTYPNREHENADRAAMRRALHALSGIEGEVRDLRLKLSRDQRVDADEAQVITGHVRALTGYLAELGILRDVREWHAIDKADANRFRCEGCGAILTEDSQVEDHKARHGLVINTGPGPHAGWREHPEIERFDAGKTP